MLSTSLLDSATAAPTRASAGARALDAAEFHSQRCQDLRDVVVELAREVFSFFFLRGVALLRQLTHLTLGLLRDRALLVGAPLERAKPEHGHQRHRRAEQNRLPEQPAQVVAKHGLAACDFGALCVEVGVVQLLDFLGDAEDGFATRYHFPPQEVRTAEDLFTGRPVEERLERLPIVVKSRLQTANPVSLLFVEHEKFGEGGRVVLTKLGNLLPVLGCALARHIE
jgi:hypothetical protein